MHHVALRKHTEQYDGCQWWLEWPDQVLGTRGGLMRICIHSWLSNQT